MNIQVMLHNGPADGHLTTLTRETVPIDLRVATDPPDTPESTEVQMYHLVDFSHDRNLPVVLASYRWQGSKLSAWGLIDMVIEK